MKKSLQYFFIITALMGAGMLYPSLHAHAAGVIANGMLVKGSGTEVYFMENGMRRWITSEKIFNDFEFQWDRIAVFSDEDIYAYPRGVNITYSSQYPDGALLRADGIKVYIVERSARRWIETEQDFTNLGLDWRAVQDISPARLARAYQGKTITGAQRILLPLTVLLDVPDKVLEDNMVKFRFTGVSARQDIRALSFETFLEGVDTRWVTVASERTITLPVGKTARYRFFVRAKDPDGNADRTPEVYEFETKFSPYYGMVAITSASPRTTDPTTEQLTIQGKSKALVDITGWTVGSEKYHTSYSIPDAFEITNHPFLERRNNIVLNDKSTVAIYTGASASGVNFRMNSCIGYLSNYYKFTPALPATCPKPNTLETQKLNAYCQKVITKSAGCKEPSLNDILIDTECRDYLSTHFTYSKCVEANYNYYNFLTDEWRVYLGYSAEIWANEVDAILLRDEHGLVVSRYKY
ncbi:MAG: hypothetical protein NUV61_02630 [Candidatus Azambacteria bacterium]|nr:hypothetical protein [Candidatus Azambacteria bacterium]